MITGQELQDARNACRLTQDELASQLGVTSRTVVNWERSGVPKAKESLVRNTLQMSERGSSLADYSDLALLTELGRRLSVLRGAENMAASDAVTVEAMRSDEAAPEQPTASFDPSGYTLAARRGRSIGKMLRNQEEDVNQDPGGYEPA